MLDYSHITLTNNTNEQLTINSNLTSNDRDFERGKDWDGYTLTFAPYETKEVLWFRRLRNIKSNMLYLFNITATNPAYPKQPLSIDFSERGKILLSSEVKVDISLPDQAKQRIFNASGLYFFSANFWGGKKNFYGKSWLPFGKLYNSYHFVIDKLVEKSIATPSKQQISLLSYNTQLMPFYANVADDLNQPKVRVKEIPRKISQFDVVILEELFDRDLRKTMTNLMSEYYPYHTNVVGSHTLKFLTGGVMIFSRWPIINEDQFVFHASNGLDSLAAKGALYAAINKQGKIYHIIGTHMQAVDNRDGIRTSESQLVEIAHFIRSLNVPADEPLLIGGDFNIPQDSTRLANLLKQLQVTLVKNIGYPYSVDFTINTMQTNQSQARIDYIFYSNNHIKPKFSFNKVFILRDLDNTAMWPKFDLSDHFPIMAYFDFSR